MMTTTDLTHRILAGAAELLQPLSELLKSHLLFIDLLGAVDTPVRLLNREHPQGVRLARFWLNPRFPGGRRNNVFHFHESRSRTGRGSS